MLDLALQQDRGTRLQVDHQQQVLETLAWIHGAFPPKQPFANRVLPDFADPGPLPHACGGVRNETGAMNTTPMKAVEAVELTRALAAGSDERFTGYGAMGVPYSGGHYLALRDMLASSVGPAYRTIWHRDPAGDWTIFTTVDPHASCPRYFGAATATERVSSIDVAWQDDWTLDVTMGTRLSWRMELATTPATRAMSLMGGSLPPLAWNSAVVLTGMGPMARSVLRSGRIRLHGHTPNGQTFKAAPLRVWRVAGGDARGRHGSRQAGPVGAADAPRRLLAPTAWSVLRRSCTLQRGGQDGSDSTRERPRLNSPRASNGP